MEKNGVSTEKILIVSRTRMGSKSRCIGGIDNKGRSYRLLKNQHGDIRAHWHVSEPFQIGEEYDMTLSRPSKISPPFKEDVIVRKWKKVSEGTNVEEYIKKIVTPWSGGPGSVFNGALGSTLNGSLFVSESKIPERSTWFWYPDKPLTHYKVRKENWIRNYYTYPGNNKDFRFRYVGEETPIDQIPKGTMVRLSLAYWWKPDDVGDDCEERCYSQLSGWY